MSVVESSKLSVFRKNKKILSDVSLSINEGQLIALIGHNGAGKSTLIKTILGLIKAKSGSIRVLGKEPGTMRELVGYLPEHVTFYETSTVLDNLKYFADLKGVSLEKVKEMISILGLSKIENQKVSLCSKGQRQKLGLAQALLTKPKLLLLDEPTVGLDPMASDFMYKTLVALKVHGCTSIVCTHELQLIESFMDKALVLNHGQIKAFGSLDELSKHFDLPVFISSSSITPVISKEIGVHDGHNGTIECSYSHLDETLEILRRKYLITDLKVKMPSLMNSFKASLGEDTGVGEVHE